MNFKEISFHDQTDHFGASFTASGNASCDHGFVFFFFFSLKLFFFPISPPGDDILTNEQCFHWKVANEISLGAF